MPTAAVFTPPCGPIQGWIDGRVVRVSGIPYAHATRFSVPSPWPDRTDTLQATDWSPACPQQPVPILDAVLGTGLEGMAISEHCQHLSITAPLGVAPGDALPVMVWIHGGSYVTGAGDLPITDPAALVAEQQVIVVTVTYRLGLFGYLGGVTGRPANLGLLDQLAALRWVQRNITAFGGDPGQVTAFGQSAGADAVAHLMATPEATTLFRRAIIQSAPFGLSRGRAAMNAAMNRAAQHVEALTPAPEVLELQAQAEQAASGYGLRSAMPFGTQYGQPPLPAEDAIEDAWRAVAPRVDVLIGHTAQEVSLFLPRIARLQFLLGLPVVGTLLSRGLVAVLTWVVYGRGSRRFARRHAGAGGRAHHYVIDYSVPGSRWGSAHTIDLPLLFGDRSTWERAELLRGVRWDDLDGKARAVREVWGRFARGEDLGGRGEVPGALAYRSG